MLFEMAIILSTDGNACYAYHSHSHGSLHIYVIHEAHVRSRSRVQTTKANANENTTWSEMCQIYCHHCHSETCRQSTYAQLSDGIDIVGKASVCV